MAVENVEVDLKLVADSAFLAPDLDQAERMASGVLGTVVGNLVDIAFRLVRIFADYQGADLDTWASAASCSASASCSGGAEEPCNWNTYRVRAAACNFSPGVRSLRSSQWKKHKPRRKYGRHFKEHQSEILARWCRPSPPGRFQNVGLEISLAWVSRCWYCY